MKKSIWLFIVFVAIGMFTACSKSDKPKTEAHVAHILIMYEGSLKAPAEVTRTREAAEIMAQDLRRRALDGEDFADLAKRHSDGPTKVRGGELTPFGRGVMAQEFEDAAFALKKGEISEVVETDFGFHVIKGL